MSQGRLCAGKACVSHLASEQAEAEDHVHQARRELVGEVAAEEGQDDVRQLREGQHKDLLTVYG